MNQPPKPNFIPPAVSQHILGTQPIVALETTTSHSGPIPSPEVIGGYEKVLAGSADRIIKMAEKEQEHRHKVQTRGQTQIAILIFVGQAFAFTLGLSGIIGGMYLVKNDKSIAGFSVFFASLASLIGVFIFNRNQPKQPPKA